jgi:hypothetical protein
MRTKHFLILSFAHNPRWMNFVIVRKDPIFVGCNCFIAIVENDFIEHFVFVVVGKFVQIKQLKCRWSSKHYDILKFEWKYLADVDHRMRVSFLLNERPIHEIESMDFVARKIQRLGDCWILHQIALLFDNSVWFEDKMLLKLLFGVPFKGKYTLFIVEYKQQTLFRRELDINQIHFLIQGINGPKTAFINMIN